MSSKKKPKTSGLEWLYLSMASFNGSGYAEKFDAESYLHSYITYKEIKKDYTAVGLCRVHPGEALEFAAHLVAAKDATRRPYGKTYEKYKKRTGLN